jgi:hypothetical protein
VSSERFHILASAWGLRASILDIHSHTMAEQLSSIQIITIAISKTDIFRLNPSIISLVRQRWQR